MFHFGVLWLVVAVLVSMVSSRRSSPVTALTTLTLRSWTSRMTWVPLWVRPMPMWRSLPWRAGSLFRICRPCRADPVVGVGVSAGSGEGFGQQVVEGRGGRRWGRDRCGRWWLYCSTKPSSSSCSSRWWRAGGLGAEPVLHGLLEAFDFAAGGGVVGLGSFSGRVPVAELFLELVAAALASVAGEAGCVDHAVVGESGGRMPCCPRFR